MSQRTRSAIRIWRARTPRSASDRAFVTYGILMVGLVAVAPLARAVWLSATSAAGIAAFASPLAPGVSALLAAVLWAGALLLGRDRGPALLPPVLSFTFASSDLPRAEAFSAPLLRAGVLLTTLTTTAAGLAAGSLVSHGLIAPTAALLFVATGALVGVVASVAWLAGQAVPRAAVPLALGILALAALSTAVPALQAFTPWGWVGLSYVEAGSSTLLALTAFALAALAAVPILLNRLDLAELLAQAVRWDVAMTHSGTLDFAAATGSYRGRPHLGRGIRAIRPLRWRGVIFVVRDAVGAARTPGRLLAGILALAAAGALLTLAVADSTPGWMLGVAAGLLAFAGLGPVSDGIRHAASVAADFPVYGISDERLLAAHALFPLIVVTLVLLLAVIACSAVLGIAAAVPLLSALALGLLAVIGRIGNALKGSLPTTLLAPIPTAMGDLAAVVRLAWALDAVLLAAASGAAAVLAFQSPLPLIAVTAILVGGGLARWRHRP